MLTAPYSIYVNKRPLRVAFLIEDKPESMAIIDTIFTYNRDRWGGRYNPIVLTDGQTLTDAWWSLLEAVDPDVVKSFVPLSADLVGAIERRISPYLIQPPDPREEEYGRWHLHLLDDGLSLLPTALNVRMASWAIGKSNLVLFETDWRETDPLIRRFVEFSFGGYSHPIHAVSRALENVRTQPYPVTDAASLVTPLTELSTFRAFTYPIQLCSVPKETLPDVEHDQFSETFHVVIGDTPTDVAYFWNRPATAPRWSRTYLNQVWLPIDVATNPQLTTALSSWLQRSADPNGCHRGRIRFVSLSLSQERLQEVVEPLTSQLRVFRTVDAIGEIQPPKIREGFPGPPGQDRMDLYRATGTTERLTLQEPDVLQGPSLGEHWMADLYIEFRPERYPTIIGCPLWWQLPRLNGLASQMFRRPSRILRTRYPSVLIKRGEPRLDIALLDDIGVFATLAALPNQPYYTLDARHEKTLPSRTPYYQARRSEKGRYLSGLLDLFGGLHPATSVLEERYWRRMFGLTADTMENVTLTWHRFPSFVEARSAFRGKACIYLQTDPQENVLRVGECDDPWERYKGGTAYALDAAGHDSGNLYFFAAMGAQSQVRKALEANLIFDLQPRYNNQHKQYPPRERLRCLHTGAVPKALTARVREGATMPPSSAKQRVLEAIEKLPPDASVEDAIERLVLLAKIERGVAELDSGKGVAHSKAKQRLLR